MFLGDIKEPEKENMKREKEPLKGENIETEIKENTQLDDTKSNEIKPEEKSEAKPAEIAVAINTE